jgi:hypothetical protein
MAIPQALLHHKEMLAAMAVQARMAAAAGEQAQLVQMQTLVLVALVEMEQHQVSPAPL